MNTRNTKCECGSGLKSKKCCHDEAKICRERREAHEQHMAEIHARREAKRQADATHPNYDRPTSPRSPRLMATMMAAIAMGGFR